jgi:hypothetical protein
LPNPVIIRMGSPDPNSRYPNVTPLTCAYWTGVALNDTAGGAWVAPTGVWAAAVLEVPVHPAAASRQMVKAIVRVKSAVRFIIKFPVNPYRKPDDEV